MLLLVYFHFDHHNFSHFYHHKCSTTTDSHNEVATTTDKDFIGHILVKYSGKIFEILILILDQLGPNRRAMLATDNSRYTFAVVYMVKLHGERQICLL